MGFYEGIVEARRRKTTLKIVPLHCPGRIMEKEIGVYGIEINEDLCLEDQVRAFIHEIWHLAPEFREYLEKRLGEDHPIEQDIEHRSDEIYALQPVLVGFLREKLREIKSYTSA